MQPTTPQIEALIERLYESENLTDSLTDPSAKLLLVWGEQHINGLAALAPEQIDEATRHIRRVMRAINRLVGRREQLSEEELVQQLLQLVDQVGHLVMEHSTDETNADTNL
jgi:hypothetical protein